MFGAPTYFYLKDVDNESNVLNGASSVAASVGTVNGVNVTFPELDIWAIGNFNKHHHHPLARHFSHRQCGSRRHQRPVVYYNLQGVRVENPANGVFIRVQGSQVTKIAK
ncbi:MAG: hypothetical protein K1V88_04050 [Muribaculaceae bacterium]|jgi:hypothetical protein